MFKKDAENDLDVRPAERSPAGHLMDVWKHAEKVMKESHDSTAMTNINM